MKRGEKIDSLLTDLRDGVKLIHLLEVISEETIPKYNRIPRLSSTGSKIFGTLCLLTLNEKNISYQQN